MPRRSPCRFTGSGGEGCVASPRWSPMEMIRVCAHSRLTVRTTSWRLRRRGEPKSTDPAGTPRSCTELPGTSLAALCGSRGGEDRRILLSTTGTERKSGGEGVRAQRHREVELPPRRPPDRSQRCCLDPRPRDRIRHHRPETLQAWLHRRSPSGEASRSGRPAARRRFAHYREAWLPHRRTRCRLARTIS